MAEVITEKVELAKLQEEYTLTTQQINTLQQENMDMTNRLKELESNGPIESNAEESIFSGLDNSGVEQKQSEGAEQ